jgi:hypothetical protein
MSEINTQKITKEFCANRRLCFHPKTPDEARFIQEQLFKMGFGWRASGEKILYCDQLPKSTLYLENGSLFWNESGGRTTDGVLCDSAQFNHRYVAPPPPLPPKTIDDVFNLVAEMQKEIDTLRQQVADLHKEVMPQKMDKPSVKLPVRKSSQPEND